MQFKRNLKIPPKFLYLPEEEWPIAAPQTLIEEDKERRHVVCAMTKATTEEDATDVNTFSNWRRLEFRD